MRKISGLGQIKTGAVISYVAMAFGIVSSLLYTPWMVKTIGEDDYALYTLAMSIINLFLLDFGIGAAVSKFLSGYYAKGEQDKANDFMGIVYKVYFIISAVIAVALLVFYFLIDGIYLSLTPREISVFKNLFIIVAVYSVMSFPFTTFNGVLVSNERFIALKLCGFLQRVFNTGLIIVFLILNLGVYALVLVHAFTNLIFILTKYIVIKRKTKQRTNFKVWDKDQAKSLFNFSFWTTVLSLSQRCIFNIMPTLIAALIGAKEVTFFSLAATIEGYVYMFADVINGMFLPKISRIFVNNDSEKRLNALMLKVGRFHIYTLGLIIVGFIGLGSQFVDIWMGKGFEQIYICAVLIILPSLIDVPQQVARTSLLVTDRIKEQALVYLLMAVVNVGLSFVFIPAFGAIGAAISIFVSYMVRTFMFNVLYKKYLPIKIKEYFMAAYAKWILPAVITVGAGLVLDKVFKETTIMNFVISGAVVVLIYAISLYVFTIDKETKQKLLDKIKR